MSEKMFETAVRNKLRFPYKGEISVEDLWDLPVPSLDSIFKKLNVQAKQANEESLLDIKSKEDEVLDLKIEIIKYIVTTKLAEEKARLNARERREKKQKLSAILYSKQEQELQNKSAEELAAMIAELDD